MGDPLGELPVKVWVFETFARIGILGGQMDTAGFPNVGPLNNADPAGTFLTLLIRPWVGRVLAYNLLVLAQLAASMLAAWALARALVGDAVAALVAGVVFGLSPLVLAYAVTGAVTDILNLWPYPLAMLGLLHALRAERPRATVGWGLFGGAMAGLGFVTCPYNFVVFASMLFPALALAPGAVRGGLVPAGPEARPGWRTGALALGAVVLALGVVAGANALYVHGMMADPDSQMSASAVSATRHTAPFRFLEPGHRDRYVAYLADYVAVGKAALIERTTAARFYRAFAPGFVALGLALLAVLAAPRRGPVLFWAGIALFCAAASTGPFLPITREVAFVEPLNPAWLLTQYALPGGNLILEPFRYALAASLALAMCAAIGAVELVRRFGRIGSAIAFALPVLVLAEVATVSPTPWPLPTAQLEAPAIYTRLDEVLPPGPILELPYFDHGSDRFYREHFFHQLLHGRPIPNEVIGFAPRYLRDNQFTAKLLGIEKSTGLLKVEVTAPDRVEADRARLHADGFVGIVLDPQGYASEAGLNEVSGLLAPFGEPTRRGDRWIYVLK
ncbi:MAG: hypothetical protein Q8P41_12895 [Pseudomonadota bacterium]|nr:hypothetical protein [Pseudomonadota bacterium]